MESHELYPEDAARMQELSRTGTEEQDKVSGPPAGLNALIERFDPEVIDVPSGSARIRLTVDGEGEWEAMIDDGTIKVQLPSGRQPDALLSADRATWEQI